MDSSVRRAVVRYLREGWAPIPIQPGGKRPPLNGWQHLRITQEDVPRLWSNGEGVGLLLGKPSGGLVDVDLDCPEAIRAADHLLPPTRRIHGRSGAPGSHRWYVANPIPDRTVRFADTQGDTMVELRSTGGQTNVPPTIHESGEPLQWEWDDEPARVNGELLRRCVQELAAASLLARHWPKKGRHELTLPLAGSLLRAGWDLKSVEAFIRGVCAAAGDEEVEDRIRAVADTKEKLRAGEHTTGLPKLQQMVGDDVGRRLFEWTGISADTADQEPRPWGVPIPLSDPSPPALPVDALPRILRRHVASVARATQTPPDLGVLLVLAAISVSVQGKAVIQVRSGWEEPLNIYAASVAPPASRKSPVFRLVFSPLDEYEVEQARKEAPDRQWREDQKEVLEKRLEAAKRDAAKGQVPLEMVEAARFDLLAAKVPVLTRLNAPDATPEALIPLMAEQGGRLAIWGPEGDPLDIAAGRYSGHGEARLDVLKKAWTGSEPIRTDRVSRDGHHIRRPALTLAVCVQPSAMETLRNTRSFVGQGVFGRILWTYPADELGRRLTGPDVPPLDEDATRAWEQLLRRLVESSPADVDDDGSFVPHSLRLSAGALDVLHSFEREVEMELSPKGSLSGIQHWSGKLVGNTVRVAGLLHLAHTAEDIVGDLWGERLSPWAMESAVRLARSLTDHAQRVFATLEADPRVALAQHLLSRTIELPAGSTERDLFNSVRRRRGLGTMRDLRAVFEILEDHELARKSQLPTTGPGRKPSPPIEINPQIAVLGPQYPRNSAGPLEDSRADTGEPEGGGSCPDPDADPDGFERWCIENEEDQ